LRPVDSLSEIHELFTNALRTDLDKAGDVRDVAPSLRNRAASSGRSRIMNRLTFNQELRRYLELRSIPHASAKIQGYRLGVDSTPDERPAQEAAE
jgi:hypothetical protein